MRSDCCNSKWFSQRLLLTEKQLGDKKKSAPTLTATLSSDALVPADVAKWTLLTKLMVMLVVVA
jgi:hypothetical protein